MQRQAVGFTVGLPTDTVTLMSTALFVNLVLLLLMAIGLLIGLVARVEHKRHVQQRKRHRQTRLACR